MGNKFFRMKITSETVRVDARIGTAAAENSYVFSEKGGCGFFNLLLYGNCVFLPLPSMIGGAVILNGNKIIQYQITLSKMNNGLKSA